MTEQEQFNETTAQGNEENNNPEVEVVEEIPEAEETCSKAAFDELNTRYLRLLADFDNFKRRTANEKNDIYKYGNMKLVTEILPVLDSFDLALKNSLSEDANMEAFQEGFAKVQRQLIELLQKDGLERIEALGVEYDPNLHEAIMVVEDDSAPANTVIDELRAGYKYKDKVLRPTVCRVTSSK